MEMNGRWKEDERKMNGNERKMNGHERKINLHTAGGSLFGGCVIFQNPKKIVEIVDIVGGGY